MMNFMMVRTMRISLSLLMPLLFLLIVILALQPARAEGKKYDCPLHDYTAEQKEYLAATESMKNRLIQEGRDYEEQRMAGVKTMNVDRVVHQRIMEGMAAEWRKEWDAETATREAMKKGMDAERVVHQAMMANNPDIWYSNCNYSKK